MTQDDRDMLVRIDENTKDLKKAVFGNGVPGLVSRMQAVEVQHDECQKRMAQPKQWPAVVASICAIVAVLWNFMQ